MTFANRRRSFLVVLLVGLFPVIFGLAMGWVRFNFDPLLVLRRLPVVQGTLPSSFDKPLLLLYFRTCDGCELSWLLSWSKVLQSSLWQRTFHSVFVVGTDEATLRQTLNRYQWHGTTLADPQGQLSRALRVRGERQAFGFFRGRLIWAQTDPEASQSAILQQFLAQAFGEAVAQALYDEWLKELREAAWGKATVLLTNPSPKSPLQP